MIAGKSLIVIASSSLPSQKTQHGKQVKVAGWDPSDGTLRWPEGLGPGPVPTVSM
jgi:hypothetical protein